MKKLSFAVFLSLGLSIAAPPAHALCSSGFSIYLAGQIPDFTFTSGVPMTISYSPLYVSFAPNDGYSCGIVARSLTPGVSVQWSYGCPGGVCPIAPTGEWAEVGDAYATPYGEVAQKLPIALIFDGTAPVGTQGTIEIAVRDNDSGFETQAVIGIGNIYVESATPRTTWFNTGSSAANVSGNRMILDHPYLNGNPGANLFITHVRNPQGSLFGAFWNHPTAVSYDGALQRWTIVNTDGAAMPTGLGFGVRYDPAAWLYCTPGVPGAYPHITILDAAAYKNPWATILVTPIDGAARTPALTYQAPYWKIVYSDNSAIPGSTCFNVKIFGFSQYRDDPLYGELSGFSATSLDWGTGMDVGGNGSGHTSGAFRSMLFTWALDRPADFLLVTKNLSPPGATRSFDSSIIGVSAPGRFTVGGRWAVMNEDGSAMPVDRTFNVWASCAGSAWYVDSDHDGWGDAGTALGSCAPIAGYATLSGDCDGSDGTRYPGSPEINDGRDNQCEGEPGHGQVDEILAFGPFYDKESFCWLFEIGASSYALARSSESSFATCHDTQYTTSTCVSDATIPAPGETYFYLVRVSSPYPGSWGVDSSGTERDPCF